MRFLRSRDSSLCLLALLLGTFVCSGCRRQAEQRPEKAPQLVRIALYGQNISLGHETVDPNRRTLTVLSPAWSPPSGNWQMFTASITKAQAAAVQKLVGAAEESLRGLHPKTDWFHGMPPPDQGTILVITWSDAELAFALPPEEMRSRLPEHAKRTYNRIDEISRKVAGLTGDYIETARITEVDNRDLKVKEFRDRLHHILAISQPKSRIGW